MNNKTDWNTYYLSRKSKRNPFRMITEKLLLRHIRKYLAGKIDTIIEIGGGDSCFYKGISSCFPESIYTIIDSSATGIQSFLRQKEFGKRKAIQADVLISPQTAQADLVFSVGLIEHFSQQDTKRCIDSHFALTRPGGLVVISYPTPTWLYRVSRKVLESMQCWPFHDERPLKKEEVLSASEPHGLLLAQQINWYIFLTQEILIFKKRHEGNFQ